MAIRLDEDWHVHSTFSDGADSLDANVQRATWRGLRHLGCVDHVRRDSNYVAEYVTAIRRARLESPIHLSIGVEAKILDRSGTLDMPDDLEGVELVYVADHQWPSKTGPLHPRAVSETLRAGARSPDETVAELVAATVAAMRKNAGAHSLVLAHLFSVLPKAGLTEEHVSDELLYEIAECALETSTMIEASERWHCPSERMIRICEARGVTVVAGTDAHRARDVGTYDFVQDLAARMSGT